MYKILGIGLLSLAGLVVLSFVSLITLRKSSIMNTTVDYSQEESSMGESYLLNNTGKFVQDTITPTSPTASPIPNNERAVASEDKNVIRVGQIGFRADDIDKTKMDVETLIIKYDGKISNSTDQGSGKNRNVSIVIKVEEKTFDKIFNELEEIDAEKIYSSSSADDVTEQVMDLQARLNTYKNTEQQLLEIQKQATNVTDTMAVYRELNEIRYKIESTESQLKYYANQTDFSTITVSITQSSVGTYESEEKWRPLGVINNAVRALGEFAKGLVNLIIWLVIFGLPIIFIVVLVVYLVKRPKK